MGDRTPYRQRVDEDLQAFVDDVARNTNLSKADVMDMALRRLKEQSTVTDDGAFEIDDYEVDGDDAGRDRLDEMLDQQREMMQRQDEMMEMMGASPSSTDDTTSDNIFTADDSQTDSQTDTDSNDNDSNENEESVEMVAADSEDTRSPEVVETIETIETIKGDLTTDETVDPDHVSELTLKEDISKTHEQCIPTVRAMLNHLKEDPHDGRVSGSADWDTVEKLITSELGLSSYTARYTYRSKMEDAGVIYPHPSSDDEIVGDGAYDDVLMNAVSEYGDVHPSEIEHPECYPDDVMGFISWAMPAVDWDIDGVYVDSDDYLEQVWSLADEIIRGILTTKPSDSRPYGEKMTPTEKIRGAGRVVVLMANRAEELVDRFDSNPVHALVALASRTDPSDDDDVAEYASKSSDYISQIDEMVNGGSEGDVELDREAVAELVGESPDVDDETLHEAAIQTLQERHPDKTDDAEEALGASEIELVKQAMHAL
jgi:beta-phosphoglucomutase-like phosphatase (HAD superfamily)